MNETEYVRPSVVQRYWRSFRGDRVSIGAALLLLMLAAACSSAGLMESWRGVSGIQPDLLSRFDPPSLAHLLGADDAGRDELARLLRGGQTSLAIGATGALGAAFFGTIIGALSGYIRGRLDAVLMRITDFVMALPHLPILIILASLDFHKLGVRNEFLRSSSADFWRIVAIVSLLSWTGTARLMRASTLAVNERDFVAAARAQGGSAWWILRIHIIPHALSPVIVSTTLAMGRVMLTESGLSFLGVGIQPPATSWGSMLSNAQEVIGNAPLLAIVPGVLIMISVIAINFVGDGLQSVLNKREPSQ